MAPIQHCPAESARPWGTVAVCLLAAAAAAARGDGVDAVRPFLARHCQACHGPDTQENEVRFDTLSGDLTDPTVLAIWQEALDEINKGSMPPAEEPRPPAAEIERMSEDLGAILREAYASAYRTGGNAIVRVPVAAGLAIDVGIDVRQTRGATHENFTFVAPAFTRALVSTPWVRARATFT